MLADEVGDDFLAQASEGAAGAGKHVQNRFAASFLFKSIFDSFELPRDPPHAGDELGLGLDRMRHGIGGYPI